MSQELLYTSAPRGLKPGSRGFCTVLSTQGMPAPLASALEGLSGYRPIFPPSDPSASSNPVVYSHLRVSVVGRTIHLLSRIADAGLDYSGRSNKLAHHLVPDDDERLPGGPANLLLTPGIMRDAWTGEPKIVAPKSVWSEEPPPSGICTAWKQMTGDAGWAGVLAEAFLADPERMVFLLVAPGQEVLPLFAEAISLLPEKERWNVTFSTYFTGLAPAAKCLWRAMIHDSKEAHESLRFVKALRIDLTAANVPAAQGGALVEAARTGIRHPEPPRKHPPISTSVPATAASTPPEEEFASAESEPPVHFAGIPEPPIRLATASGGPPPLRGTALRARPGTSEEDEEPHSSRWRAVIPMGLALLFVAAVGVGIAIWKWPQRGEVASSNEDKTEQTVVVINSPENLNPKHADAAGDLDKNDDQPNTGKAKIVAPPGQQVAEANITPSLSTNQDDTPHSKPDEKKKESESSSSQDPEPQKSFSESTTNTIAPKQPEIRRVELPTFETPATLFEFDLPPGQQLQPPKMWLLKPTWLPFLDETHRHETAVVERGTGDDRFATFTTQSKDNHHSYQLRALRDDNKIQWLAWYAVQLDGIPPIAPERFAIFMRLPLDAKTLDRNLGKGPIRWSLPADAIMNSVRIPNMKLDELSILIGQHTYSLSADMPAHDWRLPLAQYEEDTYKHCGVIPSSEPKMRVDLRLDPNEKYLELKCVGVELLQDYIDDALSSMWRVKKGVLSQINPLNDEIVADLGRQLAGINIRTEANAARGITDVKKIISRLNMLRDEVKGQNDNVNELNKAIETARQVETALEHSSQFHQSKKELKDAVITAARIHYDVTTKDKSKTLAIDVVNFEDASPAPTNQQEATP